MCSVRPKARISEEEPRTRLKLHVYGNIYGNVYGVHDRDGLSSRWDGKKVGGWGEFRANNATLCLCILLWHFLLFSSKKIVFCNLHHFHFIF